MDCAHRAGVGASTATYACIGIDAIYITFKDCSVGAFTLACAACDTIFFVDLVNHCLLFLV